MSEPSNAQLDAPLPPRDAAAVSDERPTGGASLRIDRSHQSVAGGEGPDGSRDRAFPARNVPLNPSVGIDVRLGSPAAPLRNEADPEYDRLALETSQIAAHLRQQYAELNRREQRLHTQLAQIDQERREQRMWSAELETGLEEREFAIARQEAALAQRADACLILETELKDLHETLLRERHNLNLERDQLTHDRDEQAKLVEGQKARAQHELERLRADLAREHDEAESRLKQERLLLQNRHRFQLDHLDRTRDEIERGQDDFRREQQLVRSRHEEMQAQILLRSSQLDRQRDLLEDRQRSIEREREVLLKERRAMEERVAADADELSRNRAAWESDRDSQKADLRRQQDLLALHAENLETRRQRLDQLRAELEETNRQTLELRVAVEEASAQLTQTAGAETAKRRLEEARNILAEYYRHTRESLLEQRHELEQAQIRQQQQRDEFRTERQLLVEWVSTQEEQLTVRERELLREHQAIAEREAAWRSAAERWTNEKLESETVIRDLLRQLEPVRQ